MKFDMLDGVFGSALKLDEVSDSQEVAVLPIGVFQTAKYGEVEITPEMASEIVQNWRDKVLKTDVRFDIGHDMEHAAGWITDLKVGTFSHPVSGAELPGIIATVDWTPVGKTLLSERQYRYVSSYLSSYKDEEDGGKVYRNVLYAVALCNDPVMRMLPPVVLSDALDPGETIVLGEVVDEMTRHEDKGDAHEALWDAVSAMTTILHREVEEDGISGAALVARVAELAADLPNAVAVAQAEDAPAGTDPAMMADTGEPDPVAELMASFDALMDKAEGMVRGVPGVRAMRTLAAETRSKLQKTLEGGTKKMKITLTDDMTPEARELAELKNSIHDAAVDSALDVLSSKGMTEPARKSLSAILKSENPDSIVLSDAADAEPMALSDALLAFAEAVEFVPVEADHTGDEEIDPPAPETALSEVEQKFADQLGVTSEAYLAAKKSLATETL